jgi:hypothetical protein
VKQVVEARQTGVVEVPNVGFDVCDEGVRCAQGEGAACETKVEEVGVLGGVYRYCTARAVVRNVSGESAS